MVSIFKEMEKEKKKIGGEGRPLAQRRGEKIEEGLRWFSNYFFKPFLYPFEVLGLSPNLITCLGMAFALASGYFIAAGSIPLGAAFFAVSGVLDIIDGYVAKKLNLVSRFGSFLDSFSDRISDSAVYTGLILYSMKRADGLLTGFSIMLLVNSFLISYVRAKAESLDIECRAGLMARASRFLLLGAGLFFNGISPWILKITIWILAILVLETLIERIYVVWRQLKGRAVV